MIHGSAANPGWEETALNRLFNALDNPHVVENYVKRNYAWVSKKCYNNVVADFVERFVK